MMMVVCNKPEMNRVYTFKYNIDKKYLIIKKNKIAQMEQRLQKVKTQKGIFEIDTSKILGQGGQSMVYEGKYNNQQVAIIVPKQSNQRVKRQLQIWDKLHHENVLKCYLWYQDPITKRLYIVVQKCKHNLREQIGNCDNYLFEGQVLDYAYQIVSAMNYLNEENLTGKSIMHRDIKPENILVGYDGKLKISDFGLAKIVDKNNAFNPLKHTEVGTMSYVCPQIIKGQNYSIKSDVWSTGCVILELLSGKNQFQANYKFVMQSKQNAFVEIVKENVKKVFWKTLLESMLQLDEGKRPKFKTIKDYIQWKIKQNSNPAKLQINLLALRWNKIKIPVDIIRKLVEDKDNIYCLDRYHKYIVRFFLMGLVLNDIIEQQKFYENMEIDNRPVNQNLNPWNQSLLQFMKQRKQNMSKRKPQLIEQMKKTQQKLSNNEKKIYTFTKQRKEMNEFNPQLLQFFEKIDVGKLSESLKNENHIELFKTYYQMIVRKLCFPLLKKNQHNKNILQIVVQLLSIEDLPKMLKQEQQVTDTQNFSISDDKLTLKELYKVEKVSVEKLKTILIIKNFIL